MNRYIVAFFCLVLLTTCGQLINEPYDPAKYLDEFAQQSLLYSIIRHMGKLAPNATHETKFEQEFDDHYAKLAAEHRLEWCFENNKSGDLYFLASRPAISRLVKRVGIGVKMRRESDGRIVHYEEVFRTWKMLEPELAEKGRFLFDLMVKGKDLSPYYPENSGDVEYIEFPNADTYFDVEKRIWVSTRENVMAPYYEAKQTISDSAGAQK